MRTESPGNNLSTSSRIAVCSWTLRPSGPRDLAERLEHIHIAATQVNLTQIVDDPQEWGDAIDILRNSHVWVISGMMRLAGEVSRFNSTQPPGGLLSDVNWFANRSHAEKIARVADRAGIGLVTTHIGSIPADSSGPEWAKLVDRLGAIAEIFSHYGIQLAIGTGDAGGEEIAHLLADLNVPSVGVNFDPAAIVMSGQTDPIPALRRLAHLVRQCHVRDALPPNGPGRPGREAAVGHGIIDWDAFFAVATAVRPPVQFVIERDPRLVREQDIETARDLIAYHLAPRAGLRLET